VLGRGYLDATGATNATLDLRGVPGFRSEWRHDPEFDTRRTLVTTRGPSTAAETATSSLSQQILAAAVRTGGEH
jgi:hypothetical protein